MIAHWDEVEKIRRDIGRMRGLWTYLGEAAGTREVGVRRIELAAGEVPTPAHVHSEDEEIFFVLAGSGLSWQGGETYELRTGDCIVHNALGKPHTLRGGEDGLDVLAFGPRPQIGGAYLPHSQTYWLFPTWTSVGAGEHPYTQEPDIKWPEPSGRPENIVNADEIEDEHGYSELGLEAGSVRTGMSRGRVEPGHLNAPPHCHSAEEEIFVVVEGDGTLELTPSPTLVYEGAEPESHPVRAGHVVSRPAGTRVSHVFRAGDAGLTLLAYGQRKSNDIVYYPRSNKINFRGVGVIARLNHLAWETDEESRT